MSKVYASLAIDALHELADEVSSFEEAVSRLWDDSGLGLALERMRPVYDEETDALLRQLAMALRRIDQDQAPAALLDDAALQTVRTLAARVLARLQQHGEGGGA